MRSAVGALYTVCCYSLYSRLYLKDTGYRWVRCFSIEWEKGTVYRNRVLDYVYVPYRTVLPTTNSTPTLHLLLPCELCWSDQPQVKGNAQVTRKKKKKKKIETSEYSNIIPRTVKVAKCTVLNLLICTFELPSNGGILQFSTT